MTVEQDDDLPPEVMDELNGGVEEITGEARLANLTKELINKRTEAVNARRQSGIESVWLAAEEAYIGIDDANRGAIGKAKWIKPPTMDGNLRSNERKASDGEIRSDAYVRLTARYVDAGHAKVCEILLPADEKAFSFSSTPLPDLINASKDKREVLDDTGAPLMKPAPIPATPGATPLPQGGPSPAPNAGTPPAAPGSSPEVPLTVADLAEEAILKAQESAKKAERRIHDWMVESQYRAENRKVIFDAARLGTGVLKGPFPRKKTAKSFSKEDKAIKVHSKVKPVVEWRSVWGIYPDAACGENIHDGEYIWDAEPYTKKQIRKLKNDPGYIKAAIDKVLGEDPKASLEAARPHEQPNPNQYIVWHFHGVVQRAELIAAGAKDEALPGAKDDDPVNAICTLVNDVLIRAVINPLDTGEFPYHAMTWQRRPGFWAGVGVAEQLEMPQRAINAAIRAMFNNAGKSSDVITVLDDGAITPADGNWVQTPGKTYKRSPEATTDDVRKAFQFFVVPNTTAQMMSIIDLCLKLAEESTNIPLVTQGQSGKTSPETYGQAQLQNNNANQLLRSIGYAYDDQVTERVVNQYYEILLLDDTVPDDEKGDWFIDAHGSVALVERAIQDNVIAQMGEWVLNGSRLFGVDPKRWFAQFSRTKHLNPKDFQFTPEEQAKIDAQPAPVAPQVQVAQIKSQDNKAALDMEARLAQMQQQLEQALAQNTNDTKLQLGAWKKEMDEYRIKRDTDRDTVYVQAEDKRTQAEFAARNRELDVRLQLATLEYANKNNLQLEDVKARLAETAMKLNVQREMQARDHAQETSQVIKPVAEPAGKAPNGKAFTQ